MDVPRADEILEEIRAELHRLGLWEQRVPDWGERYESMPECHDLTFFEWLQFVYLPNRNYQGRSSVSGFVAPQAMAFLELVPDQGKLLQLLVELDSAT